MLCDTHDANTYATILVSPRSRYTAVYRSSTKYRETAQVSRVSSIPCSSYQLEFSNVQHYKPVMQTHSLVKSQKITVRDCDSPTYFCISAALRSQNCASLNLTALSALFYCYCVTYDCSTDDL